MLAVSEGLATVDVRGVRLLAVSLLEPRRKVYVCIKGEDVRLQKGDQGTQSSRNHLAGTIKWIISEGPLLRVGIDCGFELTALVTRAAGEELGPKISDRTTASIKPPSIHLLPMRGMSSSRKERGE